MDLRTISYNCKKDKHKKNVAIKSQKDQFLQAHPHNYQVGPL
jgi:hypothetical protein